MMRIIFAARVPTTTAAHAVRPRPPTTAKGWNEGRVSMMSANATFESLKEK